MDPNLKLILDEFNFKVVRGSVSYLQTSLTLQIETVETNIGKRFSDLENSSKDQGAQRSEAVHGCDYRRPSFGAGCTSQDS
jgi:hypothetical protein